MSNKTAADQLRNEILNMVLRYGDESDITVYECLGALEIAKVDIIKMLEHKNEKDKSG